jgi:serine/threonine protein kinase
MDREFERLTKLGNGNFGQVIKCRNKTDGYEYAIKVTNIKNPQHSQSYLQEMQTLSALSAGSESPHIVRYFNSWVEKDKIYIVMELC